MAEPAIYEKFSATVRIMGRIQDMSMIGMRLGLEPTQVHRRGEAVEGTEECYGLDSWEITAAVTPDRPVEDHIAWLRTRLLPRGYVLKDIKTALDVDLLLEYRSNNRLGGFSMSPKAFAWLVEMSIDIQVAVTIEDGAH
ncbi:MAG TPA: DUF4279 domain-containing protein [Nitrospiria bacterium]